MEQQRSNPVQVKEERQANKWIVMAIVAIGVFMATLDSSIVNISLPTIAEYFRVPLSGAVEWIIIAYLVATASMLLTAGRLADMIGTKRVWMSGLVVFTAGSALCGAAPNLLFLVLARFFQGFGGALLMAVSPAMLTRAFPPTERGRALGFNAINVALGVSVGPTLGGLITSSLSWRWIFYVNIPIGLLGLFFSWYILRNPVTRRTGQFDPLGAILLGIGLGLLTGGLAFGQEFGWTSPLILTALIVGIVALFLLLWVERKVSDPIIVLSLFKNRVFTSSFVSLLLSFMAMFAVSFMLPFYFEQLRHFSTVTAGLLLTPLPLTIAIIAPISGTLADRFGSRWLTVCGLTICCIGLILLSQLDRSSSIWDVIWRLIVVGFGQAMFQSPNNSALLGAAPYRLQGSASGFLATGRVFGQSMSIAIAGVVFTGLGGATAGQLLASQQVSGEQLQSLQSTFEYSFQMTFLVSASLVGLGILASFVRGKEQREQLT